MTFSKIRTIALCFNDHGEATRLTEKLKNIDSSINFVISVNFNDLLEVIGKEESVTALSLKKLSKNTRLTSF